MKITPKDYVEARTPLARAGFLAIRELLDADKSVTEVATTFGIPEPVVELVKTTNSYHQYETISSLELERDTLEKEVEQAKVEELKVKPKPWHYVVAGIILIGLLWLIVWGVIQLINWVGGL